MGLIYFVVFITNASSECIIGLSGRERLLFGY